MLNWLHCRSRNQNEWLNVGRSSSCSASQLPLFIVCYSYANVIDKSTLISTFWGASLNVNSGARITAAIASHNSRTAAANQIRRGRWKDRHGGINLGVSRRDQL